MNARWSEPDLALFSISVAAELTGLQPQTLRIYERKGLVEPARSPGGTRRYSRRDIDQLQAIAALMTTGLNLAGVQRVLKLEEQMRLLQGEISRLRDVEAEALRLRAELTSMKVRNRRSDRYGRADGDDP